jgi:hypothetical protein
VSSLRMKGPPFWRPFFVLPTPDGRSPVMYGQIGGLMARGGRSPPSKDVTPYP